MTDLAPQNLDLMAIRPGLTSSKGRIKYRKDELIYVEGDPSNAVYFVQRGLIKLTVLSAEQRESVVAVLGVGSFFGHEALAGQTSRRERAIALERSRLFRISKAAMNKALSKDREFAEKFLSYLLVRQTEIREQLGHLLGNQAENRLAYALLGLANQAPEHGDSVSVPNLTQATLAGMIGTTRSRVGSFLKMFEREGFVERVGRSLVVHTRRLRNSLEERSRAA